MNKNKCSYSLTTKDGTNFEYLDRVVLYDIILNIICDSICDLDGFDIDTAVFKLKNLLHV